jgi:tetraacyldisaccharide-1-P 4'-kinase
LITTKKDWVKFPKNFQEKIDYLDIKLDFDDKILVKNLLEKIIIK